MLEGKIGCIAPGAYADLLVVDGDPLAELAALTDPKRIWLVTREGVPAMPARPSA